MAVVASLIAICLVLVVVFVYRPKPRDVDSLPKPDDETLELLGAGKKVAAIRVYRERTGVSLLEAKQVIEHHEAS